MPSPHHKSRDSTTQSKRPCKLEDEDFVKKAVLAAGSLISDAAICRRLNINQGTWIEWKNRAVTYAADPEGTDQKEKIYADFMAQVAEARTKEEVRLVGKVKKAKDWRAAAWLLERRCEGYTSRHEITGKDGVPLAAGAMPPVTVIVQSAPGSAPIVNPYALPPESGG